MRKMLPLLASAAVMVAALTVAPAVAGGFCSGYDERLTDDRVTTVHMTKNCFRPTVTRVSRSATVTFVNDDPVAHTVGGAAGSFGDIHEEILAGGRVTYRFERDGVYPYVCLLHPGMAGAIVVGDGIGPGVAAGRARTGAPSTGATSAVAVAIAIAVALLAAAVASAVVAARRRAAQPAS